MAANKECDVAIEQINGVYLIFNLHDVEILRIKYRIIGCLCGCLPRAVHQNEQLGLPLKLLNEEVYYLIEKGYGRVFRRKGNIESRDNGKAKDFFEKYLRIQIAEQSVLCYNDKIEEQMTKLNKIASGRAAKETKRSRNPANSPASVLRVTENDLKNVSVSDDDKLKVEQEIRSQTMRTLHDDEILTEIFDTSPHSSKDEFEDICVQYPSESKARLKYCVFKKLHDQGKFLTSGFKFGVDFLVYPGDPLKYHASHVAIIVGKNEQLTNLDRFAYCRLGSQVKKTVLLCTWNDDESDVIFEIVEWEKNKITL